VNAGALFFAVALAATLIFGRFVCGWACHLVALQDLCGWALKNVGFRPKPFRSRLLVLVPLAAALYMFVWPSAYRWWVGEARPPWTSELVKSDFWATFPGPVIAILTLVICGFGIVYFLGNKGFCTYACPYGGFFGVLDKFSPARIRVTEDCNGCGHCSGVCTSNVKVADEVRLYGMVVDPGCMKCMDCVSVCPNDALYFGFGRPAAMAGAPAGPLRKVRYDGTWAEEITMAVVFVAVLFCYRTLYGQVPFLFSLGLSAITTYLFLKAWHVLRRRDMSFHGFVLKRHGAVTRAGGVYAVLAAVLLLFVAHSGWMRYSQWRGEWWHERVTAAVGGWPMAASLQPMIFPAEREAIAAARTHLSKVERWGLVGVPSVQRQLAWLDLLDGDTASAEERVRRLADRMRRKDATLLNLAQIQTFRGDAAAAWDLTRQVVERQPENAEARFQLGLLLLRRGEAEAAGEQFREAVALDRGAAAHGEDRRAQIMSHYYLAESLRRAGRLDESVEVESHAPVAAEVFTATLDRAIRLQPGSGGFHRMLGVQLMRMGRLEGAMYELARAIELDPDDFNARIHAGRLMVRTGNIEEAVEQYAQARRIGPRAWIAHSESAIASAMARRFDEAVAHGRRAAELNPRSADIRANIGAALVSSGDVAGAAAEYRAAVRLAPGEPEYKMRLGVLLAGLGEAAEARYLFEEVVRTSDGGLREAARQALAELERPR
jgi:Flp pilus assembly protein TadD/ferredoxin